MNIEGVSSKERGGGNFFYFFFLLLLHVKLSFHSDAYLIILYSYKKRNKIIINMSELLIINTRSLFFNVE